MPQLYIRKPIQMQISKLIEPEEFAERIKKYHPDAEFKENTDLKTIEAIIQCDNVDNVKCAIEMNYDKKYVKFRFLGKGVIQLKNAEDQKKELDARYVASLCLARYFDLPEPDVDDVIKEAGIKQNL
jgi:nitrogen regulatory protein PII